MPEARVALVTGVSSGVGRATAPLQAERGFRVFGTVRKPTTATLDASTLGRKH